MLSVAEKFEKAIFSMKVTVIVTRSSTLVPFKGASLAESVSPVVQELYV